MTGVMYRTLCKLLYDDTSRNRLSIIAAMILLWRCSYKQHDHRLDMSPITVHPHNVVSNFSKHGRLNLIASLKWQKGNIRFVV